MTFRGRSERVQKRILDAYPPKDAGPGRPLISVPALSKPQRRFEAVSDPGPASSECLGQAIMWTTDSQARARLDTFEERLMNLERTMHGLEMDWADTLDKVKRMMQRIAKRAEVAEKAEASNGRDSRQLIAPELPGRRAQIQAAILARRDRKGDE